MDQYGADTMRLYEMFMGDFEQAAPWQTSAIAGCNRFLDRVWALSDKLVEGEGYRPQLRLCCTRPSRRWALTSRA